MGRVGTALAHGRPAKAGGGQLGELIAIRHIGPSGYRWVEHKNDGEYDDLQHESDSVELQSAQ
jgi:hypothetical protein